MKLFQFFDIFLSFLFSRTSVQSRQNLQKKVVTKSEKKDGKSPTTVTAVEKEFEPELELAYNPLDTKADKNRMEKNEQDLTEADLEFEYVNTAKPTSVFQRI